MEIKTKFSIGDRVTDGKNIYLIEEIYVRQNIKGEITVEYCVINSKYRGFADEKIIEKC